MITGPSALDRRVIATVRQCAGITSHGSTLRWRFHAISTPAERAPACPQAGSALTEYPAHEISWRCMLIWAREAFVSWMHSISSCASKMYCRAVAQEVTLAVAILTVPGSLPPRARHRRGGELLGARRGPTLRRAVCSAPLNCFHAGFPGLAGCLGHEHVFRGSHGFSITLGGVGGVLRGEAPWRCGLPVCPAVPC